MQVALSATLSRLFHYSLDSNAFSTAKDQSKPLNMRPSLVCHSFCGPGHNW